MLEMILKMSGVTLLYILLTVILWLRCKNEKLSVLQIIGIGVLYGACSILSTHFGIDYGHMLLNVRDMGPLAAGLFFHPAAGLIAGFIGGIERYIAGTYWGIGSFTRVACGISTCLAGIFSFFLSIFVLKRKKPMPIYALFIGAVMEVFHMYAVLLTHRNDMKMAYYVVKACSGPMIIFTAIGLSLCSAVLGLLSGEWRSSFNPFKKQVEIENECLAERFQFWMFVFLGLVIALNSWFIYTIKSNQSIQNAQSILADNADCITSAYRSILKNGIDIESIYYAGGNEGTFDILTQDGFIKIGNHKNFSLSDSLTQTILSNPEGAFFNAQVFNIESLCRTDRLEDGAILLTLMPMSDVYEGRDIDALETAYADILLVSSVYVLISFMVQQIVVDNLDRVNETLKKITNGDLNQIVDVRNSSEFVSLSNDINQMVNALKQYIEAAEKRLEEELRLARIIQDSALPKNFSFPRNDFELFAMADPAKEVGGDFYDFFFVDRDKLAMVIADVSGKGIPAALFMMRSKTMIRARAEEGKDPSEIFESTNRMLCDGNDAEMFVSVWIGIIDLKTGLMQCANAGHEYPAICHSGGKFEMLRDKHSLVLAAMTDIPFKEYDLQLEPGDTLFVYTDGVPEAVNQENELYGENRMLRILNESSGLSMDGLLSAVRRDIDSFAGKADQFDDITMLGFTYNGPETSVVSVHIPAAVSNLEQVLAFVDGNLEAAGFPTKKQMQIDVAVEEIFVNIANYAYPNGVGDAKISMGFNETTRTMMIEMKDTGIEFDPLSRTEPDTSLSAEEREIGGLGILMARKNMDGMKYCRENGYNILTMWKKLD